MSYYANHNLFTSHNLNYTKNESVIEVKYCLFTVQKCSKSNYYLENVPRCSISTLSNKVAYCSQLCGLHVLTKHFVVVITPFWKGTWFPGFGSALFHTTNVSPEFKVLTSLAFILISSHNADFILLFKNSLNKRIMSPFLLHMLHFLISSSPALNPFWPL